MKADVLRKKSSLVEIKTTAVNIFSALEVLLNKDI